MNAKLNLTALALAMGATSFVATPAFAVDVTYSGIVEALFYVQDDAEEDDQHIEAGDVRFLIGLEDDSGAFATLRLDADGLSGDNVDADSVAVGYGGDWGKITLGETTTAHSMAELANDMHGFNGDYEEHLAYSNTAGALSYVVSYSPEGNTDVSGLGVQYSAGGLTLGLGLDTGVIDGETILDADGEEVGTTGSDDEGVIVGAKYAFDNGFSLAAHHGDRDSGATTAVEAALSEEVEFFGFSC